MNNGNLKSICLEELESKIQENIDMLDAASSELKKIENALKKGCIKLFEVKIKFKGEIR